MTEFLFKKAEKTKLKLRLGIEGPSGSGKTMSALRVASGLVGPNGKICVLDTENDSASLYADKFNFDAGSINEPYDPEKFIGAITSAENAGYDCIIIDSITPEWNGPGGILDIHSKIPGNSFTNWKKVNPRHDKFLEKILKSKCHIIATMRSKQAYVLEENDKGKQTPKKMGMQPQQRDGVEYEFTCIMTVDISNQAHCTKDRTSLFPIDKWFLPTEETGKTLSDWLNGGIEAPKQDSSTNNKIDAIKLYTEKFQSCKTEGELKKAFEEFSKNQHSFNASEKLSIIDAKDKQKAFIASNY
jgi:DNA polymerase III delta prime subunit